MMDAPPLRFGAARVVEDLATNGYYWCGEMVQKRCRNGEMEGWNVGMRLQILISKEENSIFARIVSDRWR